MSTIYSPVMTTSHSKSRGCVYHEIVEMYCAPNTHIDKGLTQAKITSAYLYAYS